jgi:hypothetical protein
MDVIEPCRLCQLEIRDCRWPADNALPGPRAPRDSDRDARDPEHRQTTTDRKKQARGIEEQGDDRQE